VYDEKIEKLTSYIIANQKQIRLFHFSGHSGQSGLDFPDKDFKSDDVSRFFNVINSSKKLECIVLNGCENENIVRKLSEVPVVIGTRSKIDDEVASKFILDFFTSLVQSENTYEDAFENAIAGCNLTNPKVSRTRSEGGGDEVAETEPLNEYFMIINDPEIAKSKFPFNPKKANWVQYIFILFVILALIVGFLFRDKIFGNVQGYSCASIKPIEANKCNFVIGDFSTIPDMSDFNTWLYENIREATIIQSYLHAININKFSSVIHNNSIDRDSLPGLCNYDFNLTGSLLQEGTGYVADFNIFPYGAGDHSLKSFTYEVKSLKSLDTLITTLTEDNKSAFVLYNMCVACALKKNLPELPAILMGMAEKYNTSHTTEAYQRMQLDLAEVNLHYMDTASALISLDKISHAVGNDLALMAIERKIDLFSHQNDTVHIFEAQSELLSAYESRIKSPEQYEIKGNVNKYEKGDQTVRLQRAELVVKNRNGKLKEYKPVAKRDFEELQSLHFSRANFSNEISTLEVSPSYTRVPFQMKGNVLNAGGEPIAGAIVRFNNVEKITDENGVYDFGSFPLPAVIDQPLTVSHDAYLDATVNINQENSTKIVLTATRKVSRVQRQIINHH
ncbi:MAG: carboxypeptidase-like regulatory domain-containing protein, partial [Saprospiraceae bacterium]